MPQLQPKKKLQLQLLKRELLQVLQAEAQNEQG